MARYADRLLADGERVALRGRQHVLATFIEGRLAWAIFVAALVIVILVTQLGPATPDLVRQALSWIGLVLLLVGLAWLTQIYVSWYAQDYVITNRRVMKVEGVLKKRLTINQFVALTATNHARMYGLYPRKGTIAVGSDADLAIWDPEVEKKIDYSMMHDAVGYTPYEGHTYKGWPELVFSRGRTVIENNQLNVERGSGKYLARGVPGPVATATTVDGPARQLRKLING